MKYVSLFAGIGGFDLALNRLGHECVYVNDFDKYCKITYDKNFTNQDRKQEPIGEGTIGEHLRPEGDIHNSYVGRRKPEQIPTKRHRVLDGIHSHPELDTRPIGEVPTTDIPDHDLLVGGFPCQSFSIAGKRRGFDDTRGTLFFDIARILKDKRPRYFILENVKGLLSHDTGKTFQTILGVLTDLGYEYQWQVLNSKNFGVPQNRERVFIVGNRRDVRRPNVFPLVNNENGFTTINRYGKLNIYNTDAQAGKVYSTNGISPTVSGQRVNSQGWIINEKQETTINEKVYQMSEGVSSYARELLLGLPQGKGQELSSTEMQGLFSRIRQGLQAEECFEVEREPQEIRQQSEGNIQEVETLGAFLGSADDTGGVCGVVSIPTEEMLLLWNNGGDAFQSFVSIQQQDSQINNRQSRYEEALRSWEHSPLLFAVQPYQGRLFYSIGDGRDWIKIYQTKVEVICKENTLSSILEENPDPKYFLSEQIAKRILSYQPSRQDIGGGKLMEAILVTRRSKK